MNRKFYPKFFSPSSIHALLKNIFANPILATTVGNSRSWISKTRHFFIYSNWNGNLTRSFPLFLPLGFFLFLSSQLCSFLFSWCTSLLDQYVPSFPLAPVVPCREWMWQSISEILTHAIFWFWSNPVSHLKDKFFAFGNLGWTVTSPQVLSSLRAINCIHMMEGRMNGVHFSIAHYFRAHQELGILNHWD